MDAYPPPTGNGINWVVLITCVAIGGVVLWWLMGRDK